jgi:predicted nucleic acid-binding protein
MARYALDTSAVLAVIHREPGADQVHGVLRQAGGSQQPEVLLPFIVLMETEYKMLRAEAEDQDKVDLSLAWINDWPARVMESTYEWRRAAAAIKARYRLSLADAWVAALALLNDAVLVHKAPEFDAVRDLQHLRLPYDRDRNRS